MKGPSPNLFRQGRGADVSGLEYPGGDRGPDVAMHGHGDALMSRLVVGQAFLIGWS